MACILIIEDDTNLRTTLKERLEIEGHTVTEASNPGTAFGVLAEAAPPFDLITTDWRMPGKGDGQMVLQYLNRKGSKVPVIVFSSDNFSPETTSFLEKRGEGIPNTTELQKVFGKKFPLAIIQKPDFSGLMKQVETFLTPPSG